MKTLTIFFVFALLSVSFAWRAMSCRDDEVFSSCSCNEPSCLDRNPICPAICYQGCFCKPGLVREDGKEGKCVKEEECPAITII